SVRRAGTAGRSAATGCRRCDTRARRCRGRRRRPTRTARRGSPATAHRDAGGPSTTATRTRRRPPGSAPPARRGARRAPRWPRRAGRASRRTATCEAHQRGVLEVRVTVLLHDEVVATEALREVLQQRVALPLEGLVAPAPHQPHGVRRLRARLARDAIRERRRVGARVARRVVTPV